MTAAAHVQQVGQGFTGQLGAFDDAHIPGLAALATRIRENGSLSSLQLHHAGSRAELRLRPPAETLQRLAFLEPRRVGRRRLG